MAMLHADDYPVCNPKTDLCFFCGGGLTKGGSVWCGNHRTDPNDCCETVMCIDCALTHNGPAAMLADAAIDGARALSPDERAKIVEKVLEHFITEYRRAVLLAAERRARAA